MPGKPYTIELSESELVVLHEVIDRLSEREDFETLVPDKGDQQAIHNLVCLFERENPIAFLPDYQARLNAARAEVRLDP
jgi:hypothetical protein